MSASKFESLTGETDLEFPEYEDPPAGPMELVQSWLKTAVERGVREPRALALATADGRGRASSRIVVITEVAGRGLLFTTHSTSRKARDLAANPWASGLLYWRETGRQIILSGPVTPLADEECEAIWNARPIPLHSMSTASRQSEELPDPAALRAEAERLGATGAALERPARFVGYVLQPAEVEFWCARSDRLHQRLRYDRDGAGWRTSRLQP
ncbi:phenazine biosynthesis FMN-dependent oxidase PhzG [Streptomyces sp. NPDC088762]|uniref:phenazine biosynthesis FMN-dependent oxidase PhzG n=1 Tax=Streptomyces sp. NPDC088762 TaxID=3365891 RepID=UPI0037F6209A